MVWLSQEQNKAASQTHAVLGADDAIVEQALASELGVTNDGSLLASTAADTQDTDRSAADTDAGILQRNSMALQAEGFAVAQELADEEIVVPEFDSVQVGAGESPLEGGYDTSGLEVHQMTKSQLQAEVLAMTAATQQRAG